jgi:radical SAM superfamily enzyme YgiQ (UPF0313 family)
MGARYPAIPLGLITVAAMLPPHWEVRLIDHNIDEDVTSADLAWADMVMTGGMLFQQPDIHRIIELAHSHGKPVVIGGPDVTTSPHLYKTADIQVHGEAEDVIDEFVAAWEAGQRSGVFAAPKFQVDITKTPIPRYDLLKLDRYLYVGVQFSRGCPFTCEFCDIIEIYGRVPRTKSNQQMLAELDTLRDLGWRGQVFIVDDNFIGNKKNVRTLLPELAKWQKENGFPFSLITESSLNLADDEALLQNMHEAGFVRVFIGIETPVEESLHEAQKSQNRGNLLDSVKTIQSYGMEVMAGFIVGFDNDPADIFERQIDFIRKSAIPIAMVGLLNALPDTQLWRRLEREGRLLGEDASGNNTVCTLNFKTRMDPDFLIQGYQSIMRTIYSPREYYERALDSIRRTGQQLSDPQYTHISGFKALAKILLKLGVLDRERKEFWRFFTHVLIRHRDKFTDSLRLAAVGYHFRKLSDAYGEG